MKLNKQTDRIDTVSYITDITVASATSGMVNAIGQAIGRTWALPEWEAYEFNERNDQADQRIDQFIDHAMDLFYREHKPRFINYDYDFNSSTLTVDLVGGFIS